MERWLRFEHLVARIHEAVDGDYYTVEHDVTLTEPGTGRATAQIDILLRPRSPFLGPILISCKSSGERVGVDHVREWSDVVAHAGAAAGVIVSPTGFTAGAIDAAKDPTRRISLWLPRRFTDADYAPNDDSPNGYLRSIHTTFQVRIPQPDVESLVIDVEPVSERYEGIIVESRFAADTRDRYHLRDESDNVVGNLWDEYIKAGEAVRTSGIAQVEFTEPRFLVLAGRRVRFKRLSVKINVGTFSMESVLDFSKETFAYENAITGAVRSVPLPARMLGE